MGGGGSGRWEAGPSRGGGGAWAGLAQNRGGAALDIGSPTRGDATMKRFTTDAWFGPKRLGWGWRPLTWQGWLITLILVALLAAVRIMVGKSAVAFALMLFILILFALVAVVTGGKLGRTGKW